MKRFFSRLIVGIVFLSLTGCNTVTGLVPIELDKAIGEQFSRQMEYYPLQGEILDSVKNKEIYNYIEKIKNNILQSDKIRYKNEFGWKLKIIHNDSVLNAFCVAGGYIYVYTGLIKFLDNEAELAGVLAHEIAHADNRHTTMQMVSQYGLSLVVALVTGTDAGFLVNIGRELLGLSFSRSDEQQADECAVTYLYATGYDPRGVGGFFKKMITKQKDVKIPEFLSTHPASDNRVQDIENTWRNLGAKQGQLFTAEYAKAKLYLN